MEYVVDGENKPRRLDRDRAAEAAARCLTIMTGRAPSSWTSTPN